jgi:hypothetical protein
VTRGSATSVATIALAVVATASGLLAAAAFLGTPVASGATVSLRVESAGAPAPIFDGTVSTLPHLVDGGDGSGAHPCSGPSGSPASATATGALDDAMRAAGITWLGRWDPSFRDFFIDRIGPYASSPPDEYWSLSVNGRFSSGGCLARVADGDAVRFYFGPLFGDPGGGPASAPGKLQPGPWAENTPIGSEIGPSAGRLRRIRAAAERFLRRTGGTGEEWAALALAVRGGKGAATSPGQAAAALLGPRLAAQRRDGSIEGDVNATALAVIALSDRRRADFRRYASLFGPSAGRARVAARWLARQQLPDGGFGFRAGVAADVDSTGLAAWGLALAGRRGAARRAGAFIARARNPDGGFPSLPGGGSNAQSTGLALVGLRVSGIGPRPAAPGGGGPTPLAYLASLARRDGSIAYARGASPTPVWSTAQALLGLTTKAKLLLK